MSPGAICRDCRTELQREHERWLEASRGHRLEVLQRARSLAVAMIDAGDDAELIEVQLVAVGIPETTASEAVELVVRNPTGNLTI